jgi:hypothetical protein
MASRDWTTSSYSLFTKGYTSNGGSDSPYWTNLNDQLNGKNLPQWSTMVFYHDYRDGRGIVKVGSGDGQSNAPGIFHYSSDTGSYRWVLAALLPHPGGASYTTRNGDYLETTLNYIAQGPFSGVTLDTDLHPKMKMPFIYAGEVAP